MKRSTQNKLTIQTRLIDAIHDICLVLSANYAVIYCNRKGMETFGHDESVIKGLDFFTFFTPESQGLLKSRLQLLEINQSADLEVKISAFGKEFLGELRIHRAIIEDAESLVVTIRDVTEERKKELDLLRFSNVIHYTINPIQIADAQGKMVYVNPAFERASGYSKEELIGKNPNILSSGRHNKEFWRNVWNTILSGKIWTGEIENRRKNGELLHTQLVISPIIDSSGKVVGFFGAHRDITEQKYLEKQLIHSQKMESIGTLAAGIAHEVGNPLASISSVVQVLQRIITDEFALGRLELIKNQTHRITKIIRDLVDFSRPSNYEVQLTDVNKNLQEAADIVRLGKKARNISFELNLEQQIPLLRLVPDQIIQVFINILLNAVDAIYGHPRFNRDRTIDRQAGRIVIETAQQNNSVIIQIADSGRGIPEDDLSKIFEPFFTTKKVGEGTGLGLWVSYGIVKSFQGDIKVKSQLGKGTTFAITLPIN